MAYLNPLDPTTPADGNFLREADDRIREIKAALIERLQTIFADINAQPLTFLPLIIPTSALAADVITNAKLADAAVNTENIIDNCITNVKLVAMDGGKLIDNTVTGAKVVDGTLTNSKLADGTIATAKYADASVTTPKLADLSVTNSKLADNTIDGGKFSVALRQTLPRQAYTDFSISSFSLPNNTSFETADLALAGVQSVDTCIVSMDTSAVGWAAAMKLITFYGYVSSAGNVRLRMQNNTGGPVTVPTMNWRIMALRRYSDWYP